MTSQALTPPATQTPKEYGKDKLPLARNTTSLLLAGLDTTAATYVATAVVIRSWKTTKSAKKRTTKV